MGRQKKAETKPVRLYKDLADIVTDLSNMTGKDAAEILDPILRPALEQMKPKLDKMRREIDGLLPGGGKKPKAPPGEPQ